jgi:hypothetical protein
VITGLGSEAGIVNLEQTIELMNSAENASDDGLARGENRFTSDQNS